MSRVLCFLLFLVLIIQTDEVQSSYAGSASSIINPSKVKQISWIPRSLSYSSIKLSIFSNSLINFIILNSIVQSFCLSRFSHRLGMRSLDFFSKYRNLFMQYSYHVTNLIVFCLFRRNQSWRDLLLRIIFQEIVN